MTELTRSISSDSAFTERDELLSRLQEGEQAAFDEIFQLYRDMVYTLAFKLLDDKNESMDITQEVFLTLFRKIENFRGECSLKTWIYRITINQAASRNRWWRRRFWQRTTSLHLDTDQYDGHREVASQNPSPATLCFSRELRRALEEGMRQLPFEQRVAVSLRDVEGLTYEEIAEITGSAIGTVKSRIARGRERLREVLAPFKEGGIS